LILILAQALLIIQRSLIEHCASFLITNGLIAKQDEFLCPTPPENSPTLIAAWIMNE